MFMVTAHTRRCSCAQAHWRDKSVEKVGPGLKVLALSFSFLGDHLVPWPCPTARKAGKCSLNGIRGAWEYTFQKWSLEKKVECPQTTTDQGAWAVQGRKGWRGNWTLLWNLCRAGEAAQWGAGRQLSAPYKEELCNRAAQRRNGRPRE